MILLFGGTSETAIIATALAQNGHHVLVSTATDAALDVGNHPAIERRCGRLDADAINQLIKTRQISRVVDASHPFASELQQTLAALLKDSPLPFVRYQRQRSHYNGQDVFEVASHEDAATLMTEFSQTTLLTTGSRHLQPYIVAAKDAGMTLYARVLPHSESITACDVAGLEKKFRIYARGPFSVEDTRQLLKTNNIKVLITKDSGRRGGVDEKLQAAREESCKVIMIKQPRIYSDNIVICSDIETLVILCCNAVC
jgi:precorrin-6A/cobalt-precorrin-6A reductase